MSPLVEAVGIAPMKLSCGIPLHPLPQKRLIPDVLCHVKSCREVHWWSIPGWRLWWRRSSDRRPGSGGTPGLIHPPVSPDWSPGSSGWSLGISGYRCLNCGSVLGVWNWHHHIHPTLHQCHHWHKVEKAGLVDLTQKGREKQAARLRNHGSILSLSIWCDRSSWSHPCWGTLGNSPPPPCWVVNCRVLPICRVSHTCQVLFMCRVSITCRVVHYCQLVNTCRVLVLNCWVGNLCRVRQAHHTCRVVISYWSGWRLDNCDSSLLRWFRYDWKQFHITSGSVSQSVVVMQVNVFWYSASICWLNILCSVAAICEAI